MWSSPRFQTATSPLRRHQQALDVGGIADLPREVDMAVEVPGRVRMAITVEEEVVVDLGPLVYYQLANGGEASVCLKAPVSEADMGVDADVGELAGMIKTVRCRIYGRLMTTAEMGWS